MSDEDRKKVKMTTLYIIPFLHAILVGSKTVEQVSEETGISVSKIESLQRQHNGILMAHASKLHIEAQGVLNTIELGLDSPETLSTCVKLAKRSLTTLVGNLESLSNPQ